MILTCTYSFLVRPALVAVGVAVYRELTDGRLGLANIVLDQKVIICVTL
jgi:hypothetical protein